MERIILLERSDPLLSPPQNYLKKIQP